MSGDLLALGAVAALAVAGVVGRRGSRAVEPPPIPLPDLDVSLECLCADDFGASRKPRSRWTEADRVHAQNYEETKERQLAAKQIIEHSGLEAMVDVEDTDDKYSDHTDCYVRFNMRDLPRVAELLDEAGLAGDVLDVPTEIDERLATWIKENHYWSVQL